MSYARSFLHVFIILFSKIISPVESLNGSLRNLAHLHKLPEDYHSPLGNKSMSWIGLNNTRPERITANHKENGNISRMYSINCMSLKDLDGRNVSDNLSEIIYLNTSARILVSHNSGEINVPARYSLLFVAVAATLSAVVFTFGILGNILVVVVIIRTRSMHTTTNCYLLSLALADSLVLLTATLPAIPEPFYRVDEWPFGSIMCPVLVFLQYLGVDISSLSITAFTIERYIAICHPMKAQTMCTVSRAKRIIVILWIFTILYCSPWLGLAETVEVHIPNETTVVKCQKRLARSSYLVTYMIDLILFYFIPLIIATVLYLLIGRILYLSRNLRKSEQPPARHSPKGSVVRRTDSRVQMRFSKLNGKRYTCLECGQAFAHVSSLSRHRRCVHGMKKHCCLVCGRGYTSTATLSSHMKSHHPQTIQPEVVRQTSIVENLVIQQEQTLSSATVHIPYEYSTSISCTEVSSSPQLASTGSTSSWPDPAHSASSTPIHKRPGSPFPPDVTKIPKVEAESLSTDPYIIQLELYIRYVKDSMTCYSSLLETYKTATNQLVELGQQNQASQL